MFDDMLDEDASRRPSASVLFDRETFVRALASSGWNPQRPAGEGEGIPSSLIEDIDLSPGHVMAELLKEVTGESFRVAMEAEKVLRSRLNSAAA